MEKADKNKIQADKFRELLANTKVEAGDNLKFRIMQQIETEKALSPHKVKSSVPLLKNMLSIFGVMYALIAIVLLAVYVMYGKAALESFSLSLIVIAIASVCSVFGMLTLFDEKRRNKQIK